MSRLFAFLILASVAYSQERIVTVTGTDFAKVQKMLDDGWRVVAQSSILPYPASGTVKEHSFHVFTLRPPPPEVLAANEERARLAREAAWQKKREEFEKSRQVEKAK